MYSEQDLTSIMRRIGRVRLWMILPTVVLIACIVWSFILRIKWLTMLLSCLMGAYLIFVGQVFLAPKKAYLKHVKSALSDERKVAVGIFDHREDTPVERNGVMFYAFYINVGHKADPEDDRLFYYDALREMPAWQHGQLLRVTSYDKFVISVTEEAENAG